MGEILFEKNCGKKEGDGSKVYILWNFPAVCEKGLTFNLFLTGLRRLDLCAAEANIQAEWGGVHPDWRLCCGVQPELQVTLSMRCSYHFMKYSLNFGSLYHWGHDDIMQVIEYIEYSHNFQVIIYMGCRNNIRSWTTWSSVIISDHCVYIHEVYSVYHF